MRVAAFDFDLPEELIALRPAEPRDSARLLVIREGQNQFEEALVRDLPKYLVRGDVCAVNDTKVIPAQLTGVRPERCASAEALVDITLHKRQDSSRWRAFARPGRKLQIGDTLRFAEAFTATVIAKGEGGEIELIFNIDGAELDTRIAQTGRMPLPPYIAGRRPADERDRSDYQTIYAVREGAVAAPTAGLHFTPPLFKAMDEAGVVRASVTLHVGAGTFLPVKVDDTQHHRIHTEWGEVNEDAVKTILAAKAASKRILCVGTTTLRILESASVPMLGSWTGDTDIFITPGYKFKTADMLLTNFHLPRSTLFMLVSAFCGLETMRAAYAHAIAKRFRFYSYGDACLLIKAKE